MKQLNETTQEFKELKEKWLEQVKTIDTPSKFNNFAQKVMFGYEHDYGTYVHALGVCFLAFIKVYGKRLSGYQADCLMWSLIRDVFGHKDPIALKIVNYGDILYPQLCKNLKVAINDELGNQIVKVAQELLVKSGNDCHPKVKEHWEKLANGWLPKEVSDKRSKQKGIKA